MHFFLLFYVEGKIHINSNNNACKVSLFCSLLNVKINKTAMLQHYFKYVLGGE